MMLFVCMPNCNPRLYKVYLDVIIRCMGKLNVLFIARTLIYSMLCTMCKDGLMASWSSLFLAET